MRSLFLFITCLGLFHFGSASTTEHSKFISITQINNDAVIATITKSTTEKQFDELVSYFNENGISLDLSQIDYNEQHEITSIKISLKKGNQQSNFRLSQNSPISDIELGQKDGSLFITSKSNGSININSFADLFGQLGDDNPFASLLGSDFFSFNFDSEEFENFMNNDVQNFDLNGLRDQIFKEHEEQKQAQQNTSTGMPTYNFINKPGVNKLIIINGNESSFAELDQLAKQDMLADVDNLKAATAMSIYGKKAQDGAIIATTKK